MNLASGKYVAFYVRVSTDAQDQKMQHAAAEPILREVPPEQLLVFIDHGVSAAKVPMAKRPQLQQMLTLIRNGQIGTLVCYERDRLARDFYEYVEIAKLLISRKVDVVFTAATARVFDGNLMVEGVSAIAAGAEAKAIQRRVSDTVKEYPAQLFGYKRVKGEDGFIRYVKDERRSEKIADMFEKISSVQGLDDFLARFEEGRRILHRTEVQAFKLLQSPFYAACVQRYGTYHSLPHVEPITSLEVFKAVQDRISRLAEWTGRPFEDSTEAIMHPICGLCGLKMALKNSIEFDPQYVCRRGGHRVNSIDVSFLDHAILEQISNRITDLDVAAVRQACTDFIRLNVRKLQSERDRLQKDFEEKSLALARRFSPGAHGKLIDQALQEIVSLENHSAALTEKIQQIEAGYSLDVTGLTELAQHTLETRMQDKGALRNLASLLFERVIVFPDRIELLAYYSEFLRSGGEKHGATA